MHDYADVHILSEEPCWWGCCLWSLWKYRVSVCPILVGGLQVVFKCHYAGKWTMKPILNKKTLSYPLVSHGTTPTFNTRISDCNINPAGPSNHDECLLCRPQKLKRMHKQPCSCSFWVRYIGQFITRHMRMSDFTWLDPENKVEWRIHVRPGLYVPEHVQTSFLRYRYLTNRSYTWCPSSKYLLSVTAAQHGSMKMLFATSSASPWQGLFFYYH